MAVFILFIDSLLPVETEGNLNLNPRISDILKIHLSTITIQMTIKMTVRRISKSNFV